MVSVGWQAAAYSKEIGSNLCFSSSGRIFVVLVVTGLYLRRDNIHNSSNLVYFVIFLRTIVYNLGHFQQKDGEYLSGHEVFLKRVTSAFDNFAESTERSCREKLV